MILDVTTMFFSLQRFQFNFIFAIVVFGFPFPVLHVYIWYVLVAPVLFARRLLISNVCQEKAPFFLSAMFKTLSNIFWDA